jgi:hypothetical protein
MEENPAYIVRNFITGRDSQIEDRDLAYERDKEMMNLMNAYNSPVQQMERFKEAGLNPSLIYGTGSSSAAGNQSSAVKSSAPATPVGGLGKVAGDVFNGVMAISNIDHVRAQTAAVRAAELKTLAETDAIADSRAHTRSLTNRNTYDLDELNWMRDHKREGVGATEFEKMLSAVRAKLQLESDFGVKFDHTSHGKTDIVEKDLGSLIGLPKYEDNSYVGFIPRSRELQLDASKSDLLSAAINRRHVDQLIKNLVSSGKITEIEASKLTKTLPNGVVGDLDSRNLIDILSSLVLGLALRGKGRPAPAPRVTNKTTTYGRGTSSTSYTYQ